MSYMPPQMAIATGSYLPPPMAMTAPGASASWVPAQVAQASWVPPQAVETIRYEQMQPMMYEQVQPVVYEQMQSMAAIPQAIAQPIYGQPTMAPSIGTSSVGHSSLDALNQAINLGEVAKPTSAAEYYERYCRMSGQVAPAAVATTASVAPQQIMMPAMVEQVVQAPSYMPAPQMVQQVAPNCYVEQQQLVPDFMMAEQVRYAMPEQMQTYSYLPPAVEPKMQQYSYLPPCMEPMVMAAPVMAAPVMAAPVMAAPTMNTVPAPGVAFAQMQQSQPESVILDEVGDWLICEDAMGLFYHHSPTGQSHDQPPMELVQYYERQGVQLAPTGVFGVQGMMQPQMPQMVYTGYA